MICKPYMCTGILSFIGAVLLIITIFLEIKILLVFAVLLVVDLPIEMVWRSCRDESSWKYEIVSNT